MFYVVKMNFRLEWKKQIGYRCTAGDAYVYLICINTPSQSVVVVSGTSHYATGFVSGVLIEDQLARIERRDSVWFV